MLGFLTKYIGPILLGFIGGSYLDRKTDGNLWGGEASDDVVGTYPGGPPSTFDRIDKIISSFTPKSLAFILGLGWLWVDYKKK